MKTKVIMYYDTKEFESRFIFLENIWNDLPLKYFRIMSEKEVKKLLMRGKRSIWFDFYNEPMIRDLIGEI